jgi:hypothetical protein
VCVCVGSQAPWLCRCCQTAVCAAA